MIADGTPDELKDRVGGERLEVRLADAEQASTAVELLTSMSDESPVVEEDAVKLTVRQRTGAIVEAVRRLDEAGIGSMTSRCGSWSTRCARSGSAPAGNSVWGGFVWSLVILAAFAPLAVAHYRSTAAG